MHKIYTDIQSLYLGKHKFSIRHAQILGGPHALAPSQPPSPKMAKISTLSNTGYLNSEITWRLNCLLKHTLYNGLFAFSYTADNHLLLVSNRILFTDSGFFWRLKICAIRS